MKLKKGDCVNLEINVVIRCLEHDEVDLDLDDLRVYLKSAIDIYKEANDL